MVPVDELAMRRTVVQPGVSGEAGGFDSASESFARKASEGVEGPASVMWNSTGCK